MTKSVNVPPVSTPILKVGPRDILDLLSRNGFETWNHALRVALPNQRPKVRMASVKVVYCEFARPHEVGIRQGRAGDTSNPFQNLCVFFGVPMDLKCRTLPSVYNEGCVLPPTRFNQFQIENRFENKK